MVQSIWLEFDRWLYLDRKQQPEEIVKRIIDIIKSRYKCYVYEDDKIRRSMKIPCDYKEYRFVFLDYRQIADILDKLNISVDDTTIIEGELSTDFERLVYFIDLNLAYGNLLEYNYFRLGRDVWGSVGMYSERLNTLRFILQTLKKDFDIAGIRSELDLGDCGEEYFDEELFKKYFG